jgi:hypothetical protein
METHPGAIVALTIAIYCISSWSQGGSSWSYCSSNFSYISPAEAKEAHPGAIVALVIAIYLQLKPRRLIPELL